MFEVQKGGHETLFANWFVEHRVGDRRIVRLTWQSITRLANDWLPQPRILHRPRTDLCGGRSVMSVPTANPLAAVLDPTTLKRTLDNAFSSGTKPRADAPSNNEGSGFEYAARIFLGPTLERRDDRREYGEIRVHAIGQVSDDILFVVYTDRDDIRHIISARLANRKERRLWQSFAEQWKTSAE
jgi:uncharacterized DUF497 family protein